jgi:ABC-type maltose transport system permease subunit
MSENANVNSSAPQGKGAAVGGFILSLVGIVIPFNVLAVIAGSAIVAYIGLAICIISVVLCAMAMGKLKKTGGKRGLAIAGLVIGLVASVWSIMAVLSINEAIDARNKGVGELQNELIDMQRELENQ